MLDKQLDKVRKQFNQTPSTDLKYMSYSSEAVLKQSPLIAQSLLWVIAAFIVIMMTWASLAIVDEFTRGEGKIVPSSDLQVVQNLEGGILADLMVSVGDIVDRGQPLLQIDDTIFASTYRERSLQAEQFIVKAARLRAEANSSDFDLELSKLNGVRNKALVISERALYDSRKEEHLSELEILNQKASQKNQELSSAKVNRQSLSGSYNFIKRELNITRPLVSEGAVSRVELLRLERQANDLKGELGQAAILIPQLESAYIEVKKNVETHTQSFASESRGELNEIMSELGRIQQSNEALEDRVERTIVRSPMKGTVKQLKVNTIGGIIQPGMDLVEIVPFDDSLLVDARVLPSDIAFIHPEQHATVKFTAYDFSIHGSLSAKVVHISPDTIIDEEGVSYYQVRLQTEDNHLGNEDEPLPIIPGMTVQVDILTGKKTILDYILKPILKTKELAFRER
ncbi:MAG: HlyD family type I secretion periplasmic adaptor subunit [Porticoccus sp.]|nr:HlyD family type I secretion periplasmic adaptor subunit [Porticoccus sp.]MBQ0807860.1 HlyD family type I secretion periplasmic adaptor subunit [Porticoccus sp.]